eukprot:GHVL01017674.1.p1 GENE.GHVL01017674.1~~GHVL01017674.1.p1  ORF type:complete len:611 (+),score=109.93 GHVL01017674.1:20-1852(+)
MKIQESRGLLASPTGVRRMSVSSHLMSKNVFPSMAGAPPCITTVDMELHSVPDTREFAELLQNVMEQFERFHHVPLADGSFKAVQLDAAKHIYEHSVKSEKDGHETLERIITRDFEDKDTRSWWSVDIIRIEATAENPKPLHHVAMRVHHCLGDGASILKVFSRLFVLSDGSPYSTYSTQTRTEKPKVSILSKLWSLFVDFVYIVMSTFGTRDSFSKISHRSRNMKIVKMKPIHISTVNSCREVIGATLTEVMMSVLTGSLRRYYYEIEKDDRFREGVTSSEIQFRALLPSAHPPNKRAHANDLSNNFSFISCPLPLHIGDSVGRLRYCMKSVMRIRQGMQSFLTKMLHEILGMMIPEWLHRYLIWKFCEKHSCVFSSVKGPTGKVHICGQPVERIYVYFPNIIPHVEVLSYQDSVHVCVTANENAFSRIDLLSKFFEEEMDLLVSKNITREAKKPQLSQELTRELGDIDIHVEIPSSLLITEKRPETKKSVKEVRSLEKEEIGRLEEAQQKIEEAQERARAEAVHRAKLVAEGRARALIEQKVEKTRVEAESVEENAGSSEASDSNEENKENAPQNGTDQDPIKSRPTTPKKTRQKRRKNSNRPVLQEI